MITAIIINEEMIPISGDFPVIDDDFSPAIREAKRIAKTGTPCCIMWQREEDGQVAYYGPRGCSIQPHWYGVSGRPKEIESGRRVNVWLDQASIERAEEIGDGNVSAGIRKALDERLGRYNQAAEIYAAERDKATVRCDRYLRILTGIHALLYPPRFSAHDGPTWEFQSPIAKEQMQELSDRIRSLPDEIDAI